MSVVLERAAPDLRVLGPPGLARDIVIRVLGVEDPPAAAAERTPPSVVVLVDPGSADWEVAAALGAAVVLVSGNPLDEAGAAEAVLRGADAVVHAGSSPERLLEAVEVLAGGGTLLDPRQARALAVAARSRGSVPDSGVRLTGREHEILASIARGEAVKQTANTLGITAKTVENLQGRLFCKLGVRNRVQAVTRAFELGILLRPSGQTGQAAR